MTRITPARALPLLAGLMGACAAAPGTDGRPHLRYVGSSTVANFIRDAEPIYGRIGFLLDTEPESAGGEAAILDGSADLAGVAGWPKQETRDAGVVATLLGQDVIAVIVHPSNPVANLTRDDLRAIFTGRAESWREFGGPDLPIRPYVVGPASATRTVFRSAVLGEDDYAGAAIVRPDSLMIDRVGSDPGGIGPISLSFLQVDDAVKRVAVNGQHPTRSNPDYPITRPLYLLWWPGRGRVAEFISWTGTPEAEAVLLRRFAKAAGA